MTKRGSDSKTETTSRLTCEGLVKSFRRRRVVDDVDVEIQGGEVVGLLGPNGAGKTTIFYMIVGLLHPDGGKILLNGEEITSLPMYLRARKGIGYLAQEPSVFRKLTVEENLIAVLETLPLSSEERRVRLEQLLNELGLSALRKQKAYSLSGGERRRVEITRALVLSPFFILLDEPFAGIDPIAVFDIQTIIRQLKSRGIGIIITDHNVRETLGVCDRAYILNEGQILEAGTPERISRSRRARKIYLGDGFRLGQSRRTKREESEGEDVYPHGELVEDGTGDQTST
jgi:lipopolysaccharide export system ATP-binding protein